jgi:cytochrome c oxidase subunit 2
MRGDRQPGKREVGGRRPTWARLRSYALLPAAGCLVLATGCTGAASALEPRGPRAADIAGLWWLMFWLAAAVYVVVVAILAHGLFRRRAAPAGQDPTRPVAAGEEGAGRAGLAYLTVAGVAVQALIVLVVLIATIRSMAVNAAPATPPRVAVDVVGFQYWWMVRYPDRDATTANEIHIPVGEPVQLNLSSVDVIHSFWVPQLMGKMDLIPGKTQSTWIQADEPGVYWGECAEYCGIQHARMAFLVVAEPPEQFAAWLAREQQPAAEPTDPVALAGFTAIMRPSCIGCHAIKGTPASGRLGPDLTHIGSRRTIAAGTLPNNRGTLAGWIADPQHIKPGNLMPDLAIDLDTANAMAVYLETLK